MERAEFNDKFGGLERRQLIRLLHNTGVNVPPKTLTRSLVDMLWDSTQGLKSQKGTSYVPQSYMESIAGISDPKEIIMLLQGDEGEAGGIRMRLSLVRHSFSLDDCNGQPYWEVQYGADDLPSSARFKKGGR